MDVRPLGLGCVHYRRVAPDGGLLDGEVSGCGRLVYDRLENSVKLRLRRLVTFLFFANGIFS